MNKAAASEIESVAAISPIITNTFIPVPGRTLPNGFVVADFQCGKYLSHVDTAGKIIIAESVVPSVRMPYSNALKICAANRLPMLRLSQSCALALDIASVDANWSLGKVGKGKLMQGLHLGTVRGPVDGAYVSPKKSERRGFLLSNGEVIYDAAGHLFTHLYDDIHGDARGLVNRAFPADSPAVEAPYSSGTKGMGYYPSVGCNWSGRALVRGGCWYDGDYAGVFLLCSACPDRAFDRVSFRSTKPDF